MPGYVRAVLHSFRHEKLKQTQDSTYPWTQTIYKINQILSDKAPSEELDKQIKRRQKIVGKFLYYARAIDPTMVMVLNSLVAV